MSSAQSTIGVFAEVRIKSDNIDPDIAELRAKFAAGFQGMAIDLGPQLVESAQAITPQLTEAIAVAVAAGFRGGLEASSGTIAEMAAIGANGGGGYTGMRPTSSSGVSGMLRPEWGTPAGTAGGIPGVSYSPYGEVELEDVAAGGAAAGIGAMRGMGPFMALMAARRLAGQASEYMDENRKIDFTDDPSAEDIGPSGGVVMGLKEARRSLAALEKEQSGPLATPINWLENNFLNSAVGAATAGQIDPRTGQPMASPQVETPADRLKSQEDAVSDLEKRGETETRDLKAQKARESIDLDEKILAARQAGNEAEVRHLELLEKITERTERLNALSPGAGNTWNASVGQPELAQDSLRSSAFSFLSRSEDIQSDVDTNTRTDADMLRSIGHGAAANRADFGLRHDEEREKIVNDITRMKLPNSGATRDQINSAESKLNALDRTWPAEITAFNNILNQGTKDINERTSELNLENSGNTYAAERQRIEYQTNKAAIDADDGTPDGQARAAAIRGEGIAEENHLRPGISFLTPMQAWEHMQHAGIAGTSHHAATAETNPHKPGTKAYREWEVQKHIRDVRTVLGYGMDDRSQSQKNADFSHALSLHHAAPDDQSWAARQQDQHGRAWHDQHDFGPHMHAPAHDTAGWDSAHSGGHYQHVPMQFGSQGEKLGAGAGPALGPHDPAPTASTIMQAVQSLSAASESLRRNALKVSIVTMHG